MRLVKTGRSEISSAGGSVDVLVIRGGEGFIAGGGVEAGDEEGRLIHPARVSSARNQWKEAVIRFTEGSSGLSAVWCRNWGVLGDRPPRRGN